LFPNDPVLLLIAGSQHEAYAEPRIQGPMDLMRNLGVSTIALPAAEREIAAGFLQRAIDADPQAAEPRIRLGRLLGLRGRHEDARRELVRALAQPLPPAIEYYAQLFLGTEQATLAQPDEARRAFERAEALYPHAQSPRLALSRSLRDTGDRDAALSAVLGLDREPQPGADPWWAYATTHVTGAGTLIAQLRQEAAQWPR
jgi:tetratricopeptide (TPR) repeat protein